jgi:hypothetical protein
MGKTTIVISQSMYFPWAGFLEQVSMADVYVVYDDVQFSKGSFTNRVQAKTAAGSRWLTVPLRDLRLGQRIDEVQANDAEDWRSSQRGILRQAYRDAPFLGEMMDLVDSVLDVPAESIGDLSLRSTLALAGHLGIDPGLRIVHARDLASGEAAARACSTSSGPSAGPSTSPATARGGTSTTRPSSARGSRCRTCGTPARRIRSCTAPSRRTCRRSTWWPTAGGTAAAS